MRSEGQGQGGDGVVYFSKTIHVHVCLGSVSETKSDSCDYHMLMKLVNKNILVNLY